MVHTNNIKKAMVTTMLIPGVDHPAVGVHLRGAIEGTANPHKIPNEKKPAQHESPDSKCSGDGCPKSNPGSNAVQEPDTANKNSGGADIADTTLGISAGTVDAILDREEGNKYTPKTRYKTKDVATSISIDATTSASTGNPIPWYILYYVIIGMGSKKIYFDLL